MNDVGQYIKKLREAKGLTQEQLGEIVGVKKAAVQKWESGMTQNLKRTTIKILADFFEVSPVGFVDDENSTPVAENTETEVEEIYKIFNNSPIDKQNIMLLVQAVYNMNDVESDRFVRLVNAYRELRDDQQKHLLALIESLVK